MDSKFITYCRLLCLFIDYVTTSHQIQSFLTRKYYADLEYEQQLYWSVSKLTCSQPTLITRRNRGKIITETGTAAATLTLYFTPFVDVWVSEIIWLQRDTSKTKIYCLVRTEDFFLFVRKPPCHVSASQPARHSYIGQASLLADMHLPARAYASSNDSFRLGTLITRINT
jgi:hypothetical protein